MTRIIVLLICIACVRTVAAEEFSAPQLTEDQRQAVEVITEGRVLSAVSFLASDELAGRDSPSPELTIATSYVASRFRGAGLEPLGPQNSYYQVHELFTSQPPEDGLTLLDADGRDVRHLGLMCAGPDAVDLTATVTDQASLLSGTPVNAVRLDRLELPAGADGSPRRILAAIARRLRPLRDQLPDVVFLPCDGDSTLPEAAEWLRQHPVASRDGQLPGCAVVLVADDDVPVGSQITVRSAAQRRISNPVRNVIGVLRGSDPELAEEAVLVSAHLDHIGMQTYGADRINNGADDNATGVTAVLSLADAFSELQIRPRRSIVFMTFWGEEKGLKGSAQFVKTPLWPLTKIVANINIEMVGRPEKDARGKAWMTGWAHSNLGDMMNAGSRRMDVEIFNRTDVGEMLYSRSDNYSFVRQGVIAHSFSAGSLHADYHQPSDEWDKLDIPHMTKVIRGLFAGTLLIADGPVAPRRSPR